jgi:hypothetical protein
MKLLTLALFLAIFQNAFAQIKSVILDKKAIPKSIRYTGHIITAVRYTDNEGEHIVITTETGEETVKSKEDGDSFRKAEVYAYDYKVNNGAATLYWQMHDFTDECSFDIKAKYVPNTFAITDLNKDGKAEVWLMYMTACRSDVSPASMKIIMHEGIKKYAVRGTSRVRVSDKDYVGGEHTMDPLLKAGPEAFRQYALQLWKKNLMEKNF